jgi:hypothetical protein
VGVAAAVGVNIANSSVTAFIPDNGHVSAGGVLSLTASNDTDANASADGSAVAPPSGNGSSTEVGVGVAINVATSTNDATIGHNAVITAQGLALSATMTNASTLVDTPAAGVPDGNSSFGATAVSGAGAPNGVTVAGALALNIVTTNESKAEIYSGANVTLSGGNVCLTAVNNSNASASASSKAQSGGGSVGVGASVALNLVNNTATAQVDNTAQLSGPVGNLTLSASSMSPMTTSVVAGAQGGTAIGPAVAIAIATNTATASLGTGPDMAPTGSVSITASHTGGSITTADATAAGSKVGVGVSVGLNIVSDAALATTQRNLRAGGSVTITSSSSASTRADAMAGENGAPMPNAGGSSADSTSSTETNYANSMGASASAPSTSSAMSSAGSETSSEGDSGIATVGVAAAVGINVATTSSTASIPDGLTVTGNGAFLVQSTNSASSSAHGIGTAVINQTSVGAGVSLNIATVVNEATVGTAKNSSNAPLGDTIAGNGVTVQALQAPTSATDQFNTWGLAGAGGSETGAAGSVSINVINDTTEAFIGANSVVNSTGGLTVAATNGGLQIRNIAGAAAFGGDAGVGVAIAVNVISNTDEAFIDQNVQATATGAVLVQSGTSITAIPGSQQLPGDPVALPGALGDVFAAAVGGSIGGDASVAGSVVVNVITTDVSTAVIGPNVAISSSLAPASSVTVQASNTTTIEDGAGGISAGGDAGVGLGIVVDVITKDTEASIDSSAQVYASGPISLSATGGENITTLAVEASAGGEAGVSGSIAVDITNTTTKAFIDSNATVQAGGNLSLSASDPQSFFLIAGNVSIGGAGGVGVSNTTLVRTDVTEAYIGQNATIMSSGGSGLSITASTSENVTTLAVGGAGGGSAGVAGSATVNVWHDTTLAYVDHGTTVNATSMQFGVTPSVLIQATDTTTIFSTAGALALGGSAGIGAGVDVGVITKDTEAYIATATVTAGGDVRVLATSSETITSIDASVSVGGSAAVAGNAGVYVLNVTTRAFIGLDPRNSSAVSGPTMVTAGGTVQLASSEVTQLSTLAGNFSVGGDGAVGAAVAVPIISKTTESFVGAGASVTALGNGNGVTADTGQFTVNENTPYGSSPGTVTPPSNSSATLPDQSSPVSNPLFTNARTVSANTVGNETGLIVTAVNEDELALIAGSGGVGGAAAVTISGAVNVLNTTTQAYIAGGAQINTANDAGATGGQSVHVASGDDFGYMGIALAVAVAGAVGVTPDADVIVVNRNTYAYIGDGATVNAVKDVSVAAFADEGILSLSFGAAVAGVAGVSGSVSVIALIDSTLAYIGSKSGSGATVNAGGNVLVAADDSTTTFTIAGTIAVGLGGGFGAGVAVTDLSKDTEALVGPNSSVNAGGNSSALTGIDQLTDSGVSTVSGFTGLAIQATSSENVTDIAAAGAGGFYVGLAGGVSIEVITSTTKAYIGTGASINQTVVNPSSNSSVNIFADNSVTVFGFGGGLGGGIAGIGGGIDVGVLRNNTAAYIDTGAQVNAQNNVSVTCYTSRNISSYGVSAAGGIAALAGSVSVWTIDSGSFNSNYSSNSDGSSNPSNSLQSGGTGIGSTTSNADSQAGNFTSLLGNFNSSSSQSSHKVSSNIQNADGMISSNAPDGQVDNAINNPTSPAGTAAYIAGNTTVHAGLGNANGSVNIRAREDIGYTCIVGSVSVGVVGIGGSVNVVTIQGHPQAFIGAGATVGAGSFGSINVAAKLNDHVSSQAFAGQAGLVALGAQVVVINDSSEADAYIDGSTTIAQAGAGITIGATINRDDTAMAIGGGISAVTAGAAVADVNLTGGAKARLGGFNDSGRVNVGTMGAVGGLTITANGTNDSATASATEVSAGLFGGLNGAVAIVSVTPTIESSINNANVNLTGGVTMQAGDVDNASTTALGVAISAGLSGGASVAIATLTPNISTTISSSSITAGGTVGLESDHNRFNSGNSASASATTGSGGLLAGASGAVPIANATATVNTTVSSNSHINAASSSLGNVSLTAYSNNDASAHGFALAIGGFLGLGTVFATATDNSTTQAQMLGSIDNGSGGVGAAGVTVQANATDRATATAQAGGGGLISGQGAVPTATVSPTITADIGRNTNVDASGSVNVGTASAANANASASVISIGVGSLGATPTTAIETPTVNSFIGQGATVQAGGGITIMALNNYNSNHHIINGATNVVDGSDHALGAQASGEASGGGIIGVNSATVRATSSATVKAYADSGVVLVSGGTVTVQAYSNNDASAMANGQTFGFVGVGVNSAYATANGSTEAYLGGIHSFTSSGGGGLNLYAQGTGRADSKGFAASGGLISVRDVNAVTNVSPLVEAHVSTDSPADQVQVAGGTSIIALADGQASANAVGYGGGLVDSGTANAAAGWRPNVEAFIGGGTQLTSGSDITVEALNNVFTNGTQDTGRQVNANATASSGGLASVPGATAQALVSSATNAIIGGQASVISTTGSLSVTAQSYNNANSTSTGNGYGLVAVGSTTAMTVMQTQTHALAQNGSSLSPTTLGANGNIQFLANSDNVGTSNATGGAGGLVGVGSSQATAQLGALGGPLAEAGLGAHTVIDSPNANVSILAQNQASMTATSNQTVTGGVVSNETDATATINGQTQVNVGDNSMINVRQFTMSANDQAVSANANTNASVPFDLAGGNTANSAADINSAVSANLGHSSITAATTISILASTGSAITNSQAQTHTTGLTGTLTSIAESSKTITDTVNTAVGSQLTATTVTAMATAPRGQPNSYTKNAQTDAKTVTHFITEVIGTVCEVIGQVVCLWGLICNPDTVCHDITQVVAEILGASTNSMTPGSESISNTVNMNSNITLPGASNPVLDIGSDGTVNTLSGFSVNDGTNPVSQGQRVTSGTVAVTGIMGGTPSQVVVSAPGGNTAGSSMITVDPEFTQATIDNDSSNDLVIGNLDAVNSTLPPAVQNNAAMGLNNWMYTTVIGNGGTTTFSVTEDVDSGDHNIIMKGHINNPNGQTLVHNLGGGSILTQGSVGSFNAASIAPGTQTITFGSSPNLFTGQEVQYNANGGTVVGGLIDGNSYFAIVDDPLDIKLAQVPTAISITPSSGTQELDGPQGAVTFDAGAAVDSTLRTITFSGPDNLNTGDLVTYFNDGNASVGGLTSGTQYYVLAVSPNIIQLSLNPLTNPITFTSAGTGTQTITPLAYINAQQIDLNATGGSLGTAATPLYLRYPISTGSPSTNLQQAFGNTGVYLDITARSDATMAPNPLTLGLDNIHAPNGNITLTVHNGRLRTTVADASVTTIGGTTYTGVLLTDSFDPEMSGTVKNGDILHLPFPHQFTDGELVTYQDGGGQDIGGLHNGGIYQVLNVSFGSDAPGTDIELVQPFDAHRDVSNNTIRAAPTGSPSTFTQSAVTGGTTNTITFSGNLNLSTGQAVVYQAGGGNTAIGGLTSGFTYYVIVVSQNNSQTVMQLSPTALNAQAGVAIGLDPSVMTGTQSIQTLGTFNFVTGDQIVYSGSAVGGLVTGQTYTVRVIDASTIELTNSLYQAAPNPFTFAPSAVSANTINLGVNPGFSAGQAVIYHTTATPIGGLTDNATYYALVSSANPTDVQLMASAPIAITSSPTTATQDLVSGMTALHFQPSTAVNGSTHTITITGHGLSNGQTVVYHANMSVAVPGLVDGNTYFAVVVDANTIMLAPSGVITLDPSTASGTQSLGAAQLNALTFTTAPAINGTNFTINFGFSDGFTTGQAVIYQTTGAAIGGLSNGGTYYVVVVNPTAIQLASSFANATASTPTVIHIDPTTATGTQTLAPATGTPLTFAPPGAVNVQSNVISFGNDTGFTTGQAVVYQTTGNAIGGLTNGGIYYVIAVSGSSFQLASSFDHATAMTPVPIVLDPTTATGTQTIGAATGQALGFSASTVASSTISFGINHSLVTGQPVIYSAGPNPPIGLLKSGHTYYVIVQSPTAIQLATTAADAIAGTFITLVAGTGTQTIAPIETLNFTGAAVSGSSINFGVTDNLVTGEAVVYTSSGTPVQGLTSGQPYFVLPTNPSTIQLLASAPGALNVTPAVPSSQKIIPGNQANPLVFDPSIAVNGTTHAISFTSITNLTSGQLITYSANGGTAVPGLTDGSAYFVIAVSSSTIQLATATPIGLTPAATSSSETLTFGSTILTFDAMTGVSGTTITFSQNHNLQTGDIVKYKANGGPVVGGLMDQTNYAVIVTSPTTIELTTAPTSPPALAITPAVSSTQQIVGTSTLTFDPSTAVNGANRTITFTSNHGLANGATVTYHANGGATVPGLTDGSQYYVIVVNPTTIQLAAVPTATPTLINLAPAAQSNTQQLVVNGSTTLSFDAMTAVDGTNHTITFASADGLVNGQSVIYNASGNPALAGLYNGDPYYVVVVDPKTIKLASAPFALALNPAGATGTQRIGAVGTQAPSTVNDALNLGTDLTGSGITTGSPVFYESAGDSIGGLTNGTVYYAIVVSSNSIQLATSPSNALAGTQIALNPVLATGTQLISAGTPTTFSFPVANVTASTIGLTASENLQTGQAVVYQAGMGNTPIGGLTSGQTYFVIAQNAETIQLAATATDALNNHFITLDPTGATGTQSIVAGSASPFTAVPYSVTGPAPNTINFGFNTGLVTGQPVVYRTSGLPITGLSDGTTYYVIRVNSTTIALASSAANAASNIRLTLNTSGVVETFQPSNVAGNSITFASNPGFTNGQSVVYRSTGTDIGGLTSGSTYFVIIPDPTQPATVQLLSSPLIPIQTATTSSTQMLTFGMTTLSFDPSTAVNGTTHTITFSSSTGLTTGQLVTYNANGATAVSGLTNGGMYFVVVVNATTIQLSATAPVIPIQTATTSSTQMLTFGMTTLSFDPSTAVNGTTHTITFSSSTGLTTGQQVTYNANGGAPVSGLTNGGMYVVVVVNATTIQLLTSQAISLNPTGVTGSQSLTTSGYSLAPVGSFLFDPALISSSTIQFPSGINPGFLTGQPVLYRTSGVAIGGLTSGQTYFAIVTGTSTIQLATSAANAANGVFITLNPSGATGLQLIGAAGASLPFVIPQSSSVDGTTNTINFPTQHGFSTGDTVTYRSTGKSIGGLISGTDYYVWVQSPTAISLLASLPTALGITAANVNQSIIDGSTTLLFDPSAIVSNTITVSSTSAVHTGDTVTYNDDGNPPVVGLTNLANYYLIVTGPTTIQVSLVPMALGITPAPSSTQQLTGLNGAAIVTFNPSTDVNGTTHQITVSGGTLNTDDLVTYNDNGNAPISGITSGNSYAVNVVSGNSVELSVPVFGTAIGVTPTSSSSTQQLTGLNGAATVTFDSKTGVDGMANTITVTGTLNNGDLVVYNDEGNPDVGLTNGNAYVVSVVSTGSGTTTIQLSLPVHGTALALTPVASSTQTLAGMNGAPTDTFDPSVAVNGSSHMITITAHGYNTGDLVVYHQGATQVPGLNDNTTYYVLKVDNNTIELSNPPTPLTLTTPLAQLVVVHSLTLANNTTLTFDPGLVNSANHTITFGVPDGLSTGDTVTYHANGTTAVPDLMDNVTYYVIAVTPTSVQLAPVPTAIHLNPATAAGTQSLGTEGVRLSAAGTSVTENLVIALNPAFATGGNVQMLNSVDNPSIYLQSQNSMGQPVFIRVPISQINSQGIQTTLVPQIANARVVITINGIDQNNPADIIHAGTDDNLTDISGQGDVVVDFTANLVAAGSPAKDVPSATPRYVGWAPAPGRAQRVGVYLDNKNGLISASAHARIEAAMATLNQSDTGLQVVEVLKPDQASIILRIEPSDRGREADDRLGYTTFCATAPAGSGPGYERLVGQATITLFADKPWYFGADGHVPADLYDYETVVLHELGHAIGLQGDDSIYPGLNSDDHSAMAESLVRGVARRELSPRDLAFLQLVYGRDSDVAESSEAQPLDFTAVPCTACDQTQTKTPRQGNSPPTCREAGAEQERQTCSDPQEMRREEAAGGWKRFLAWIGMGNRKKPRR